MYTRNISRFVSINDTESKLTKYFGKKGAYNQTSVTPHQYHVINMIGALMYTLID